MGIQEVSAEILRGAEEEAKRIEKSAQEEADRLLREAKAQASALKESAERSLKAELEQLERREISVAELESRHAVLQARHELIARVFGSAEKAIMEWDEHKRRAHLSLLLDRAKRSFAVGRVHASPSDARLAGGSPAPTPMLGGIVAESEDGAERLDMSYDAFLKELREKKLKEVADILFK